MTALQLRLQLAAVAVGAAAVMITGAPHASAGVQSDVLCSSNIAYRNLPGHKAECADIAINSHGGGGAADVSDADGDHVPAFRDADPNDPMVH